MISALFVNVVLTDLHMLNHPCIHKRKLDHGIFFFNLLLNLIF